MPIYAYKCAECNHTFDKLQKMNDDALTDCPECNEPALKKQITASGFRLTGNGWYETDFKTGSRKNLSD